MIILREESFEFVSAKVRARTDVDSALSSTFGRSQASAQEGVIEALSSYVRALDRDTDGKWVPLSVKHPERASMSAQP